MRRCKRKTHVPLGFLQWKRIIRRPTRLALRRARKMKIWGMLFDPEIPF